MSHVGEALDAVLAVLDALAEMSVDARKVAEIEAEKRAIALVEGRARLILALLEARQAQGFRPGMVS